MALPTVGAVFGVLRIYCQKFCNSFFVSKKCSGVYVRV